MDKNAPLISLKSNAESNNEVLISEDLKLFSSLSLESNDVFDNDSNLFVEQSFYVSSLETTFQHRVLVPKVENSDDLTIQFTF